MKGRKKQMLIRFAVSNFLSFDGQQELSLEAGKARKYSERLYVKRKLKLVKCEALFGCNASGKSNLVEALQFVQDTVEDGFPRGFSNNYYRLREENRLKPSCFCHSFLLPVSTDSNSAIGNIIHRFGKQDPFRLLHHTTL